MQKALLGACALSQAAAFTLPSVPSISVPAVSVPAVSLPSISLPDVGLPVVDFGLVAAVGGGAVVAGGAAFVATQVLGGSLEDTMGPAFEVDEASYTPAMRDALALKQKKASLKYKFVDPIFDSVETLKDTIADKAEQAKKDAEAAKKAKAEQKAREEDLLAGRAVEVYDGVVVPNPFAIAKQKAPELIELAKEKLDFEEPKAEKSGLPNPFEFVKEKVGA